MLGRLAFALLVSSAWGCGDTSRLTLGAQCDLTSDCRAPYICALERCRFECRTSADCGAGLWCEMLPDQDIGVCLLPDETGCGLDSDCPSPLVCRGECTTECREDRDCAPGARCAVELEGPACIDTSDRGCVYDSECPEPLVCGDDARCRYECRSNADCDRGRECFELRCRGVPFDGGAIDAGADAGPDLCESNAECSNDVFCDGVERCRPGEMGADMRGCLPPSEPACAGGMLCNEAADACFVPSDCDSDMDGADSVATRARPDCAGRDCNDADPLIRPGTIDDCNFVDDDCDTRIDEAVDFETDPLHCGWCGNRCRYPNAIGVCAASSCRMDRCLTDFYDRDGELHNGCEYRCTGTAEECDGADNDCDGTIDEDAAVTCGAPHATGSCVAGRCAIACDPGFDECNGDPSDGCEADLTDGLTCGSCTNRCGAALGCDAGVCGSSPVVDVEAGGEVTCFRRANGRVGCFGNNLRGALGEGSLTSSPRPVTTRIEGVTDLEVGGTNSTGSGVAAACGTDAAGSLTCWGGNADLLVAPVGAFVTVPVARATPAGVVDLSISSVMACALSGTAVGCFGRGRLGDGGFASTAVHVPVTVDFGGADVVDVETGAQHACAVLASGEVRCWGDNQRGALGDGTETERLSPRAVLDVTNAVSVSAGFLSTCVRLSTAEARCWGLGSVGQRGDGTTTASALRPVAVRNADNTANLGDVAQIVSGDQFTCVRFATGGGVSCFGTNAMGQLGDGTGTNRSLPTPTGLTGAIDVTAGANHACALLSSGELRCWGRNADGQLGIGATSMRELSPVAVVGVP